MLAIAGLVVILLILALSYGAHVGVLSLWYCFDDYLSVALNNPALGNVPFPVIMIVAVFTLLFLNGARSSGN